MIIADNQKPFAKALDHAGHHKLLGDVSNVKAEQIRSELLRQISGMNPQHQKAGGDLTDGFGSSRVAIAMLGPKRPIQLRLAEESDEALLLRWANDTQVRKNSFSKEQMTPSSHHRWFSKVMADPNRLLLIASTKNNILLAKSL